MQWYFSERISCFPRFRISWLLYLTPNTGSSFVYLKNGDPHIAEGAYVLTLPFTLSANNDCNGFLLFISLSESNALLCSLPLPHSRAERSRYDTFLSFWSVHIPLIHMLLCATHRKMPICSLRSLIMHFSNAFNPLVYFSAYDLTLLHP